MTAQIKFFPEAKAKKITVEELKKLRELQHLITGARNEMLFRIKDEIRYWQVIEKDLFHEKFRQRIKLAE